MLHIIGLAFIGLFTVYLVLWALASHSQDGREPEAIDDAIPFVTACISLISQGSGFFGKRSHVPIYTLRLPWLRVYVVNSLALIPLVQRKSPTVSFKPILIKVAGGIIGFSRAGLDMVSKDHLDDHGLLSESGKVTSSALGPGPKLAALDARVISLISSSVNGLSFNAQSSVHLNLYEWVSQLVIRAATEAVYGPENPFKTPGVIEAWKSYGKGFIPLLLNFMPHVTARKSVQARESVTKGFEEYYENKGYAHPEASTLIKDRFALFSRRGMSMKDMARHEAGATLALLGNTIPATFWFLYRLLSNPNVLEECRYELLQIARVDDENNNTRVVDMGSMKNSCPIFNSTFRETLRFHSINVAARIVVEDTVIDNRYLLKKNGVLLIPSIVQHQSASVWGVDVGEFNHKRFVGDSFKQQREKRLNPMAFRVFGGGSVVCPGRYFAATEMLAVAAMAILRFDVQSCRGYWSIPTVHRTNPGISIQEPDHDIEVMVRARDDRQWEMALRRPADTDTASDEDLATTD